MRYLIILAPFIFIGCATVGSYQQECEKNNSSFQAMVKCLNTSISSNSRMSNDANVKMYLLRAEQLNQKVSNNELSDIDAKVELQKTYLELKHTSDSEIKANTAAYYNMQNTINQNSNNMINAYMAPQKALQPLPIPTNCTTQFLPNGFAITNCNK